MYEFVLLSETCIEQIIELSWAGVTLLIQILFCREKC